MIYIAVLCSDLAVTVTKTITKSNSDSFTQTITKTESNYGILYKNCN